MFKKIIAYLLVFCIFLGMSIPAYAYENDGLEVSTSDSDALIISSTESPGFYMKAYELSDGTAVFDQYIDHKLVSRYTVKDDSNIIYWNDYSNGQDVLTTRTVNKPNAFSASSGARGSFSGRLGRVRFEYTSGGTTGICGAYVDYEVTTGSKIEYDITGTYKELASFASFLCALLSWPASTAGSLAAAIINKLGIAATVAPFFVPSFTIDASYVLIEYTLTNIDNSAHKNEFSGTVYTCIEKGHNFNKQYKVGKYYPLSAWETTNFAITVYSYMFGYEYWSVYSWD